MALPTCTVLIVENFAPDRELYRRCLLADTTCGYRLLEVDTATEGLELCRTEAIDAILLDYALPDSDGLAFLQDLKAQNREDSPPVVIVTGQGDETVAVQAIKLGAEDYLVKRRLTPDLLRLTVRSAIENARLRLQLQQSNDRFRVSIENMFDCFSICSAIRSDTGEILDFRIDYLNAAAMESNQTTTADIGKRLCELYPAHHETGLFAAYCQVVETGEPLVREKLIYSDVFGTQFLTRAFDIHASKLDDGLVISWRDVTARKQAELYEQLQAEIAERQRAEGALQKSNDRFELAATAVNCLIYEWDLQQNTVERTPSGLYTITGYLPEEAEPTDRWWLNLMHPDDRAKKSWERLLTELATLDRYCNEYRIRHKQGHYVWVEDWATVIKNDRGQPIRVVGSSRDISDRKQDEQLLRESESRLQLGVQVAGVAIAHFDYGSNQVTLSPEAAALFGIPAEELIVPRDRIHATFHPEEREEMAEMIRQVLDPAGQGWFAREHRVVWQTGEVRWLNVRKQVYFDRSGETPRPDSAILAAIDITDRKRAEAALQQSEERYRSLAGLIPQLVWIADPNGGLLDVNERWSEYTGLPLPQAQSAGWEAIVHPEDIPPMGKAWSAAQESGTHYQAEGRMRRADGLYRWHLHQAIPLKDQRGQILKWFGTATDIDDIKQIQVERARLLAEAEAARKEAEAANRSKDEFVALVAHELRSPLNAILGWARLLQTRDLDAPTTARALETIARNTQSQVQLVEDLLDVSRMVRGTLQLTLSAVDLVEVIEAALETVSPTATTKQIQLSHQLPHKAPVWGDFHRLQQVILNLLTNAIKFTPSGGRVAVRLDVREQGSRGESQSPIHSPTHPSTHPSTHSPFYAQITVTDTGKGISADFLPYVFQRFRQDQHNTTTREGLGLGLAIVKHIVELQGGTVAVSSAGVGQGATFTVILPLLDQIEEAGKTGNQSSSPDDPLAASSRHPLSGLRILLVDDQPDMLDLATFALEEYGAIVETANSAAAALEKLPQFKPQILLSDIAMPQQDGFDLLRQVRSIHPEGQIPAIALTAYTSDGRREEALQVGFQQYITKPLDPEELVIAISGLIELAQ